MPPVKGYRLISRRIGLFLGSLRVDVYKIAEERHLVSSDFVLETLGQSFASLDDDNIHSRDRSVQIGMIRKRYFIF